MIYLDNNATSPIDPKVVEAMRPLMEHFIGNPSSIHRYGQKARGLLTEATRYCADFFKVNTDEVIFTSGATEGLNFLIRSLPSNSHLITSTLEHVAVLEPLKVSGASISYLSPYAGYGSIGVQQIKEALRENTRAIILTYVNNETGIITDELEAIADLAHEMGIWLIVDGVAALGKMPIKLYKGISAICFSGHKIHAPLGVGLTLVRKGFKAHPLIVGGAQQRNLRAGTENLPAIVGFAKALQLLEESGAEWITQMTELRNIFEERLYAKIPNLKILGQNRPRVCNTSMIAFVGLEGETLLIKLDLAGVAASHGSACSSGTLESSRVLLNMGLSPQIARAALRFSLSRFTTSQEIAKSIDLITAVCTK